MGFESARNVTPSGSVAATPTPRPVFLPPNSTPREAAFRPSRRSLTLLAIMASSLAAIGCGLVGMLSP